MVKEQTIHHILAKSYMSYFLASLVGLFVDSFLHISFEVPFAKPVAVAFLAIGPMLMFWAQHTSWKCQRDGHSALYFHHGPYQFIRNPTHLGMLILVTGYTLISGSLVFFGTTLLGFLISNIFFGKYESLNDRSFGESYKEYKSKTPKI